MDGLQSWAIVSMWDFPLGSLGIAVQCTIRSGWIYSISENHAESSEIQKILVKPFQKCQKKWIWAKFYCASLQLKMGGFNPRLLWRFPCILTIPLQDLFSPSKCCHMDLNFGLNFRFFHLGKIIFHAHRPVSYLNLPQIAQNQGMSKFQNDPHGRRPQFPWLPTQKVL